MTSTKASPTALFFFLVLPLAAGILLINLDGWDLWNPDEPRYAQVAREMVETGQYIVPHLNGKPYPDKPPLFFWLVAALSKLYGDATTLAARLPSVIAALGVLVLTYVLGCRVCDPLTALFATIILFTTEQFFTIAISAHLDPLLTLLTTAALLLLYGAYQRFPAGAAYCAAAYACMGLALLTKGPVGLCVPVISFLLFLILKKEWRSIRHLRLGTGLLLAGGILALWLVPACLLGGEEYRTNILFTQTFGRAVDSYSHKGPFYYYLLEFPVDFFPWSIFIPSACIYFWKHRSRCAQQMLFPLAWFLGTFLFFSLISGKRSLYLLPLYSAAALLMARFWADIVHNAAEPLPRLVSIPFKILCGLLIGFGVGGAILFSLDIEVIRPIHHAAGVFYTVSAFLVCGGISGFWLLRRMPRSLVAAGHVAGMTACLFVLIVVLVFPAMNSVKSGRFFCERIKNHVRPHDRLIATFEPELFNYFLHRYPIPVVDEINAYEYLQQSSENLYVLTRGKEPDRLTEKLPHHLHIREQQQIGHRYYFLLTHRPRQSSPTVQ